MESIFWQGRKILIPDREFELLEILVLNHGEIVSYEALLKAYGWSPEMGAQAKKSTKHSLTDALKRLRRRLSIDAKGGCIRTERGKGLCLEIPRKRFTS